MMYGRRPPCRAIGRLAATYERGVPNVPAFYVAVMQQCAPAYPGRRIRAVNED
jgi:hypothetical protein